MSATISPVIRFTMYFPSDVHPQEIEWYPPVEPAQHKSSKKQETKPSDKEVRHAVV